MNVNFNFICLVYFINYVACDQSRTRPFSPKIMSLGLFLNMISGMEIGPDQIGGSFLIEVFYLP